jgi:hypothetical protein
MNKIILPFLLALAGLAFAQVVVIDAEGESTGTTLSSLDASKLTEGTVPIARLPAITTNEIAAASLQWLREPGPATSVQEVTAYTGTNLTVAVHYATQIVVTNDIALHLDPACPTNLRCEAVVTLFGLDSHAIKWPTNAVWAESPELDGVDEVVFYRHAGTNTWSADQLELP